MRMFPDKRLDKRPQKQMTGILNLSGQRPRGG